MAKPNQAIVIALVGVVLAVAVLNRLSQQQPQEENAALSAQYTTVTLFPQNATPLAITAEVANTEQKMATGLMFRKSLGKDDGMLFVFSDSAVRNFWMKNTLIQLDMVFIAENMTIVKIHNAVPCTSEPCPAYNSGEPVKYVLEVNSNFTAGNGIAEGGKVVIEN